MMNIRDELFKFLLFYCYRSILIYKKLINKFKNIGNEKIFIDKKFTFFKLKKRINYLFHLIKYDRFESNFFYQHFIHQRFERKKFNLSLKKHSKAIKKNSISFYSSIKFTSHKSPLVSIIIPVYKDSFYTALCLKSIQEAKTKIPYEVIVVDDSPHNEKIQELDLVKNIKLISNKKNIGYLNSCNDGAKKSKAKFLCMLNNDTYVFNDWLDNLHDTFKIFPSAGIVGSLLLNKDFTIQECGSFIFKSGYGYNYGKSFLINSFQTNFTRKVSYCSAASILIDSKLFKSVKGFSKEYYPAYYEDVDLAYKLLKFNKFTYCNPLSKVVHFGSISMGQGDSPVKTKLMIKNKKTFLSKWKDHLPNSFYAIEQLYNKNKSVIFFEEHLISPKSDAGSLSIFNFAKLFQSLGYEVIFCFKHLDRISKDFNLLLLHGFQVMSVGTDFDSFKNFKHFLNSNYIKPEILYIARPEFFSLHIDILKKQYPNALVFYDTVDLHYLRMQRENLVLKKEIYSKRSINRLKKIELSNMHKSDISVIRSKYEINHLKQEEKIIEKKLLNLSLLFSEPNKIVSFKKSEGMVFVGNFNHTPNIDALNYFFDEIITKFNEKLMSINIYIIGKNGKYIFKDKIKHVHNKVTFIDFVDDINSFLINRRLNLAPLRYGAGIKGKIAQAFVIGLPTISTNIGFEGMDENVVGDLKADKPNDFAKKIENFYFGESSWTKVQNNIVRYSKIWTIDPCSKLLKNKLISFNPKLIDNKGMQYNKVSLL